MKLITKLTPRTWGISTDTIKRWPASNSKTQFICDLMSSEDEKLINNGSQWTRMWFETMQSALCKAIKVVLFTHASSGFESSDSRSISYWTAYDWLVGASLLMVVCIQNDKSLCKEFFAYFYECKNIIRKLRETLGRDGSFNSLGATDSIDKSRCSPIVHVILNCVSTSKFHVYT